MGWLRVIKGTIWCPIRPPKIKIAIWLFRVSILGRGAAWSRLGAKVPKLHQNVGTCMGLVGQLLSQNWCSQKMMLGTPPPPPPLNIISYYHSSNVCMKVSIMSLNVLNVSWIRFRFSWQFTQQAFVCHEDLNHIFENMICCTFYKRNFFALRYESLLLRCLFREPWKVKVFLHIS